MTTFDVQISEESIISLEFDKLKNICSGYALGPIAYEKIINIHPSFDFHRIKDDLEDVDMFLKIIQEGEYFPLNNYELIDEDLKVLPIEDYVLSVDAIQRIFAYLIQVKNLNVFFRGEKIEMYSKLYKYISDLPFDADLIKAIDKILDEEGNIRNTASSELVRIRRMIGSKNRELDSQFRKIANDYKSRGMLSDTTETLRNERRVLAIPAEYKRQVRGILHDESATGKTVYIEPEAVISINNEIFDLHNDEKKEIFRLMKYLSEILRPHTDLLRSYQETISTYDFIRSKAYFAHSLDATLPTVKTRPAYKLKEVRHPLLFLKNKAESKKTIPFDYDLRPPNRILLLSGPNAGGKSVTLKAVGLVQLMVQCGMLIPTEENAEIGLVKKIFTDIGDQQSLDDELSTYSSRLENMKQVLKEGDNESMILIDEFGSGTDPQIGGAIAQSILLNINDLKMVGLITTHYPNLKSFAYKQKGLVNGSMTFDKDHLTPRYELKIGRPGSSYAFEIAQRVGLDAKLIKYARSKVNNKDEAVDGLLTSLQAQKQSFDEKLEALEKKERKAERLVTSYESLKKDLDFKKRKFLAEQKSKDLQFLHDKNKELERVVRELRQEKNIEKAKELVKLTKVEKKEVADDIQNLRKEMVAKPKNAKPIAEGDFVKLVNGSITGKVVSIKRNKATVSMGGMKVEVHITELVSANEPIDIQTSKSINTNLVKGSADLSPSIDIRGMGKEEALTMLESYFDKSYVAGAQSIKIVHGKGTGILRKLVWEKLREYQGVMDIRHPEPEFGGDGVTYVDF